MKLKDPFAKKGLAPWKKWAISLAALVVVASGLWLGNLLSWAGLSSPLKRFQPEVEVVVEEPVAEVEEMVEDAEVAAE
jgi:hypothetical protein